MLKLFRSTYPIFLGYISVGFVFGVVATTSDLSITYTILTSIFIYAGAAQFLLVNALKVGMPLYDIFISIFLLNIRHIFYFKPLEKIFARSGPKKWYSVLALTDESFALLSGIDVKKEDTHKIIGINQIYWVSGTILGSLLGSYFTPQIEGLDFSLLALFMVLFIEKLKIKKDLGTISLVAIFCLVAWFAVPPHVFLIIAITSNLLISHLMERSSHG